MNNLFSAIKSYLIIWRGRWRILWGFCPECNSDAPKIYDCPVCQWKYITTKFPPTLHTKRRWWTRFVTRVNLKKNYEVYHLIIVPDDKDGGISIFIQEIHECIAQGVDLPEAMTGLSDCIRLMLDDRKNNLNGSVNENNGK